MERDITEINRKLYESIKKNKTINQKVIAGRIGISAAYLSQILNNKARPSYELTEKIAQAVGISMSELVGVSEAPTLGHSNPNIEKLAQPLPDSQIDKIDDSEIRIIRMYRALRPEYKQEIIDRITDLYIESKGDAK